MYLAAIALPRQRSLQLHPDSDGSIDKPSAPEKPWERSVASNAAAIDVAAGLTASNVKLDPEAAAKLRRKIDWYLMPLMCIMYLRERKSAVSYG
ncbi:hypothetical protein C8F01DRAFT_1248678 [Mycena amicta]|nr:hypothetical protein C8F01DRAFT_1248678 [Mycena amicta]